MNALVLKNFSGLPEILPSFWEAKTAALAAAKEVTSVQSELELTTAVAALRNLKALTKGMEDGRKFAKAPILELGKKIDATANDAITDVVKAENIILGMVNHFQNTQLRLRREAEQAAERDRLAALKLEEDAKRLREEAEKQQKPELLQEAVKMEEKAFDAQMASELSAGPLAISKPKGLVVKNRLNYQVIDPHAFCQAYPEFFSWNAETETLKVKRREILEELNKERGIFRETIFPEELPDHKDSRIVKPAGLRVFEETSSFVR